MSRLLRLATSYRLMVMVGLSCGSEAETTVETTSAQGVPPKLTALVDEPSAEHLLAALARSHADARAFGPHRLAYTASFELTPPETKRRPKVGDALPRAQAISDALELRWAAKPGEPPKFALHQENSHDKSRDVVLVDERVYTKNKHGDWYEAPLESRLYERWLDEAERSVHDLVALAAPRLAVSVTSTHGPVEVELRLADKVDPALTSRAAPQAWRAQAKLEQIDGHVTFEPTTGMWTAAKVDVRYTLPSANGPALAGHATITAERTGLRATDIVTVPAEAQPIPERPRYEPERERLLSGLGGR